MNIAGVIGKLKDIETLNKDNVANEAPQMEQASQESLDLNSLKHLAGVETPVEECGGMSMAPSSSTPAQINMTAASGEELSSMIKDIMSLAGVSGHKHDEPADAPLALPAPTSAAPTGSPDMKSLLGMIGDADVEAPPKVEKEESDNRPYSNSPDEEENGDPLQNYAYEPNAGAGDVSNRGMSNNPRGYTGITAESLYNEYQKFKNQ